MSCACIGARVPLPGDFSWNWNSIPTELFVAARSWDLRTWSCHGVLRRRRMFALLCLAALLSQQVSAGITDIRALPGQNVTLPCRAPNSNPILAIEWFKPGQEETYLLLYRAGLVLPDGQHPAYRSRVAFQKEKTKDGDASLTLRAVTVEDSGTYTCVVSQRGTSQTSSRQILPTTFIRLMVDPAPSSSASRGGGSLGRTALQLVLAVMVSSV